jgi:hypothetical protein
VFPRAKPKSEPRSEPKPEPKAKPHAFREHDKPLPFGPVIEIEDPDLIGGMSQCYLCGAYAVPGPSRAVRLRMPELVRSGPPLVCKICGTNNGVNT